MPFNLKQLLRGRGKPKPQVTQKTPIVQNIVLPVVEEEPVIQLVEKESDTEEQPVIKQKRRKDKDLARKVDLNPLSD